MFLSIYGLLRSAFVCAGSRRMMGPAAFMLMTLCLPQALRAQGLEPGGPVDMGSVSVGASSTNYTFTFSATTPTTIQSVAVVEEGSQNEDFVLTPGANQTCTGTISPPHSCNVTITFTPKNVGYRRGALLISDSSGAIVNTQLVYGIGLAPQLVFQPVTSTIVSTLSGLSPSTFQSSSGVYDGAGDLFFNDFLNGRLLELSSSNAETSLGSYAGNAHSALAISGTGTLYLSMPTSGAVEVIPAGGSPSVLAHPGVALTSPAGLAVDGSGFIYIADSQANQIIRVAADGSAAAVLSMSGLTTPLSSPYGLAINHDTLYIADSGNGRIVEVATGTGVATALTPNNALNQPYGISVDAAGNLVVASAGGSDIVQVSSTGTVFSLTPDSGVTVASTPLGEVVAPSGDVVSFDSTLGLVFLKRSTGQLTFPTPTRQGSFDSTDGYESLTVQNSGNEAITIASTSPTDSNTDFALGTTNSCPVNGSPATPFAIGAVCTYTFGFTPSIVGSETATVGVRGTSVSTGYNVTGTATLIGTGITPVDTLKVVASPSNTTPGNPVSFTVTAYQGTTVVTGFTGTVNFTMTDPTGVFLGGASYTFKASDNGTHTFPAALGAEFNSTGTFTITAQTGSVTGVSNNVVVLYNSQTTLASSVNPVALNGQTTLTATVKGLGTGLTPGGTVAFYDGTTLIGTCTLVSGTCSTPVTITSGGSHSLTATYGGSTIFAPSTSNTITETVSGGFTAMTAVTTNTNPSTLNSSVNVGGTLEPTSGETNPATPTGTVTFYDGATKLATITVNSFGAIPSFPVTFTTLGNHDLTMVYSGDSNYASVTSPVYVQVVQNPNDTAVLSITTNINPSALNQTVNITGTLTPKSGQTNPPALTGTVTFYDGTTLLASSTVNGNYSGTVLVSFTTVGNHNLTLVYSGDANYSGLTSSVYVQVVGNYTATAAITTNINPSAVNQSVTVSGTLTPKAGQTNAPALTGSVSFYDGTTKLGSATVNGNYSGAIPVTFTTTGNHNLTLVYTGDANYAPVTSSVYVQVVSTASATASVTTNINPSSVGQSVNVGATFTATAGQANPPAPAGTLTFYDGTTKLGTETVTAFGVVPTFPVTFTTAGNHNLTAVYSGDANYAAFTSAIYVQVVNASSYTDTAHLTSSANPVAVNQQTTLTATVAAVQNGAPTPTGKVTFYDGSTVLGSGTLTAGSFPLPASFATAGSHSLTVVYAGDTNFPSTTSTVLVETVTAYSAKAVLTSSVNPSLVNQQTTLTVTVAATAGQGATTNPTGTVTFYSGSAVLGTATLASGVASIPASFAVVGTDTLTVVYGGDTSFGTATSNAVTQVVNPTPLVPGITLASSSNPVFIENAVSLTATLTAASGAPSAPTGTVTFLSGGVALGTSAIVNGQAVLPVTFPATGTYTLTAIYNGDTNYGTASSNTVSETTQDFTLALTGPSGGSVTVMGGSPATYTFAVTPVNGVTLPGAVSFTLTGFPSGSTYSFSPSTLASGTTGGAVTLTVTPPVATAHLDRKPRSPAGYAPAVFAFLLLPFTLAFGRGRGRRPAALLLWVMLFASALGLTGCLSDAQSGYYGTTPATFSLTITASSGPLARSAGATLVRQ